MTLKLSTREARAMGIDDDYLPGRKAKIKPGAYAGDKLFDAGCIKHGIPLPVSEHRFAPPRRWRFDHCWPEIELALEIQGGIWTAGRHVRGAALLGEMEKLNTAAILGWRVMFCTPQDIKTGLIFELLRRAFAEEGL